MSRIITERQYQNYIIDYLVATNKYTKRTDQDFDRYYALDKELLFKFLEDSQPKEVEALKKIYKDKYEEILIMCEKDNIASNKTILVNGGVLINKIEKFGLNINRYKVK